jgi:hypothetical protein
MAGDRVQDLLLKAFPCTEPALRALTRAVASLPSPRGPETPACAESDSMETEVKRTSNVIEMMPTTSTGEVPPPPIPSPRHDRRGGVPPPHPRYVDESLHDAEAMVAYAAEVGIEIDEAVRRAVLEASITVL